MNRYVPVLLAMAAVIAAPMILRPPESARTADYAPEDRLVIITPHVETLRYELERAFARWMKEKHRRSVVIDWRVPGGTSDIIKVVDSEFKAAADNVGAAGGIGLDLMLGGGPIDYSGLKKSGYIVPLNDSGTFGPAAVKAAHPEWFTDTAIPASVAGQIYYDPDMAWIGTCLSAFGICWNVDNLARRGIDAPRTWSDLARTHYENQLAVSDPTKSGTVAAMFECILQISVTEAVREATSGSAKAPNPNEPEKSDGLKERSWAESKNLSTLNGRLEGFERLVTNPAAWNPTLMKTDPVASGWDAGLRVIRRIGANARYWTDSSTKIPLDVAEGEALAGMCVDFYGRNLIERLTKANGESRLGFVAPRGGTTISPQPVAMFRGAPNPELATRFIEFILSPEGQKLWGFKAGAPGGPERMALRNMPLRRDYYVPENLQYAADPELRPLEPGVAFTYEPKYTADLFSTIRFLIRAMCIDPHLELKEAWHELITHNFPPEATAAFDVLPGVDYETVRNSIAPVIKSKDSVAIAKLARELSERFRLNYLKARDLARDGE
jgi:iron(III) transport system substrate-binding protein